ncbi:SprT family zinc-dependent metalloprotease [Motilimonas pumila]|uniref:Protein SprT n=1 Tax=Motilimonas pumila TaxID=2303987 RepID=A0A418YAL1_9GAMM|nr:SprT family zinc-dependent metalloprotease [Motilimonas pumila]RJG40012.1 SprT family zinc-dependent metalloprotease [Motilimonas pumila]
MLLYQQKQALVQQVKTCYEKAECFFDRPFPFPTVLFNQRGKAAGTAHLHKNLLKFNGVLYQENQTAFLTDVVPHEVCHLLAYHLYGQVPPHGPQWQHLMRSVMEVNPSRTHDFDTRSVQGQLFTYQCQCQQHQLTIRRHNKAKRGQRYICRRCRSALTFIPSH